MEQKSFGNDYSLQTTIQFFKKWWKLLLWIFLIGTAISMVASLLITPRYKSSAILFPTSSNRLSKAVLTERYSLDYMDYGIERDCEYAIQILTSQSMMNDVCSRFGMLEHYGISQDDPHKMFKLAENYRSNVNIKRTEFLGIEISVLDVDPEWAANIANYIATNYDTLCRKIQLDRANDAYNIMQGVCNDMEHDILLLEDSIKKDPKHGLALNSLMENKCKELAQIQTRMSQTKVDLQQNASYKFWLDQATPADKKAYPKRAIIVLLGALGSVVMCILVLLLVDRVNRKENE